MTVPCWFLLASGALWCVARVALSPGGQRLIDALAERLKATDRPRDERHPEPGDPMKNMVRRLIGMETAGDQLARAAAESGFQVDDSDHDSCVLDVECLGEQLQVFLMLDSDNDVAIRVFGTIRFRPNGLPERVCDVLEAINRKGTHRCHYAPFHGSRDSRFSVLSWIPFGKFNARTLHHAVADMAPRMTALDEYLVANGYAR